MAQWFVSTGGSDSTGTGTSGNPFATPGKAWATGNAAAGDTVFVATGTYTTSSSSSNVAGGIVNMPAGTTTATTRMIGTDGSFNPLPLNSGTSQPKFTIGTGTSITAINLGANCDVENMTVDGNSATGIKGFGLTTSSRCYNCQAKNCKNSGFTGTSANALCILCYATTCSTIAAFVGPGFFVGCVASANTFHGFNNCFCLNCLSLSNSGSGTDGYNINANSMICINSVAYANGRHGFNFGSSSTVATQAINCYAEGHTAAGACGYTANAALDEVFLLNCAGYNNTTNIGSNITAGNSTNFQALSASGVVSASGGNFLPLPASALVANGLLGAFPVISSTGFQDIGAIQSDYRGGTNQPIIIRGQMFPVY